jgi:hypothetical protein
MSMYEISIMTGALELQQLKLLSHFSHLKSYFVICFPVLAKENKGMVDLEIT